jgi:hypothetical protein
MKLMYFLAKKMVDGLIQRVARLNGSVGSNVDLKFKGLGIESPIRQDFFVGNRKGLCFYPISPGKTSIQGITG